MSRILTIILFSLFATSAAYGQGWAWGKGGTGNNAAAWAVATDNSENVYAAGVAAGVVSFDGYALPFSAPGNLCLLVKYDWGGNFMWARSTQNSAHAGLINITTDNLGNCYVLGWLNDSSIVIGKDTVYNSVYPHAQYFLALYDAYGNVSWATSAGGRDSSETAPTIAYGGTDTARMMALGALAADAAGNVYVAACYNLPTVSAGTYTLTNSNTAGGTDDIMLVKYSNTGNIIWARSSGGKGEDIPFGMAISPAGALYVAGMYNSDTLTFGTSVLTDTATGGQRWNAFIARYDTAGHDLWGAGSGGAGTTYAGGVATDISGNVYLAGGMEGDTISFAGQKVTDSYPGRPVAYLVKFDTYNNPQWNRTIGSAAGGTAWGYGASSSAAGTIWISGAFTDTINISGNMLDTPAGSTDPVFAAGYDTMGNYLASGALQSGGYHQADIACSSPGGVYICGSYSYPCAPFTVGPDVLPEATTNEKWMYAGLFEPPDGPGGGPGSGNGCSPDYTGQNLTMCPTDTLLLLAPPNFAAYLWDNGSTDTMRTVTGAGAYLLTCYYSGNGDACKLIDTFTVTTNTELCSCTPYMPDAFTPNGDSRNDTYAPVFQQGCAVSRYAFSIYNRWGQRVFYTEDPYARWDGTYNGQPCNLDTYMYYLRYTPDPKYQVHVKKGDLTLIR